MSPARDVCVARSAVAPSRPTGPRTVAGRPADDQQPRRRPTCRIDHCASVAAGVVAVLPLPRANLEGQWATGHRPFATGLTSVVVTEEKRSGWTGWVRNCAWRSSTRCSAATTSGRRKTFPTIVMQVVRFLATTTVTSLLDQDEDTWRAQIGRPGPNDDTPRALLIYANARSTTSPTPAAGTPSIRRDVWQMRRLGFPGHQSLTSTTSRSRGCGPGQAVGPVATRNGPGVGGRPSRIACPNPVRPVLRPYSVSPRAARNRPGCWNATWPICTPS